MGLAESGQYLNEFGDDNPESGMGDFRYNINDTLEKALADFNNALKADNQNFEAVRGRAKTYYRMQRYEEAALDYKRLIKKSSVVYKTPELMDLVENGYIALNE